MRYHTRLLSLVPITLVLVACATGHADDAGPRTDGRWAATYASSPDTVYEMVFSGDRFEATHGDAWYKGDLVIDTKVEPATMDFVIRECDCGFVDKRSAGIFRWDGEAIELRAPEPGDPRPTEFDMESSATMLLERKTD